VAFPELVYRPPRLPPILNCFHYFAHLLVILPTNTFTWACNAAEELDAAVEGALQVTLLEAEVDRLAASIGAAVGPVEAQVPLAGADSLLANKAGQ